MYISLTLMPSDVTMVLFSWALEAKIQRILLGTKKKLCDIRSAESCLMFFATLETRIQQPLAKNNIGLNQSEIVKFKNIPI